MQITAIQLSGFKSFAEPTSLPIDGGLTVIVGPNGCGKSNIIEAVRWVMGESSAKRLRGDGMEDVIFAGTESGIGKDGKLNRRKRRSAMVALHLDNSSRTAPLPFQDAPELVVSRSIERGQGSTYRINGQEVRARDVQLLFADLSIGSRSASIISQGEIADLVDSNPTARRLLLEEAAGIRGLQSRRHEAELKLGQAENNLLRLDDVLQQGRDILLSLERQARACERYREQLSARRHYEALGWYLQEASIARDCRKIEVQHQQAEQDFAQAESVYRLAAAEQIKIAAYVLHARQNDESALLDVQSCREKVHLSEREYEQYHQQLESLQARIMDWDADQQRENERLEQVQHHLEELRRLDGEIDKALPDTRLEQQAAVSRYEQSLTRIEQGLETLYQQKNSAEGELIRLKARYSALEQQAGRLRNLVNENQLKQNALETLSPLDQTEMQGLVAAEQQAEYARVEAINQAEMAYAALQFVRSDKEALDNSRVKFAQIRQQFADLENEHQSLTRRLTTLSAQPDTFRRLLDVWTIPPKWQMILARVLDRHLQASLDRASPVVMGAMETSVPIPPLPEGVQSLHDALMSDGVSLPKGWHALAPRLQTIGVCEDLRKDCPNIVIGQVMVDYDGNLAYWHGLRRNVPQDNADEVKDIDDHAAQQMAMQHRQQELIGQIKNHENALKHSEQALAAQEADFQHRLEHSEQAHQQAQKNRETAVQQAKNAEQQRRESESEQQKHLKALQQNELAHTALKLEADQLVQQLQMMDSELADFRQQMNQHRLDPALLSQIDQRIIERRETQRQLETAKNALITFNAQFEAHQHAEIRRIAEQQRLQQAILAHEQQRDSLQSKLSESQAILPDLQQKTAVAESSFKAAEQQQQQVEYKRAETARALQESLSEETLIQTKVHRHDLSLASRRETLNRLEVSLQVSQQQHQSLLESASESMGLSSYSSRQAGRIEISGLAEKFAFSDAEKLLSIDQVKSEREAIDRRITALGEVNLRAEIDAKEQRQNLERTIVERDDIQAAISELRNAIQGLNKQGKTRLQATFDTMNGLFARNFEQLFSGGEASLEWLETDDPIAPGIDIAARPPGKAKQSVHLLSGGEKALTAMALVAAVMKLTPTPICLLDEVDAALDDANVDRFCQLLQELSGGGQKMRFVVISHHRLTMAKADRLMGVGMPEKGVSRLYAVDLLSGIDSLPVAN